MCWRLVLLKKPSVALQCKFLFRDAFTDSGCYTKQNSHPRKSSIRCQLQNSTISFRTTKTYTELWAATKVQFSIYISAPLACGCLCITRNTAWVRVQARVCSQAWCARLARAGGASNAMQVLLGNTTLHMSMLTIKIQAPQPRHMGSGSGMANNKSRYMGLYRRVETMGAEMGAPPLCLEARHLLHLWDNRCVQEHPPSQNPHPKPHMQHVTVWGENHRCKLAQPRVSLHAFTAIVRTCTKPNIH